MRKSDFYKQQALQNSSVINKDYLPQIIKVWQENGYDPDYLLDTKNNFYNVLEDYHLSNPELKKLDKSGYGATELDRYIFSINNDISTYRLLYFRSRDYFCGFYNVKKHAYFSQDEVACYALWNLSNVWERSDTYGEERYDSVAEKYQAIMCNVAALQIAEDVTQYYDEKKMCDAKLTMKNLSTFVYRKFHVGKIFDPEEMRFRKPKDFKEFTHYIHTQYWFYDPSKGYRPDAPYKWDESIPDISLLIGKQ